VSISIRTTDPLASAATGSTGTAGASRAAKVKPVGSVTTTDSSKPTCTVFGAVA